MLGASIQIEQMIWKTGSMIFPCFVNCSWPALAMASLLDSEAQFTQRTIDLKLSEELKRSLHRAGLLTFGTFAYAHGQPGQNISDEGFETWVTGQLLTGATLADVAGATRLLFESQTMC